MTRPLNEHLLWKGCIQKAGYPKPVEKPPMILPNINRITGKYMDPDPHEQIVKSYEAWSQRYWEGVKRRTSREPIRGGTSFSFQA